MNSPGLKVAYITSGAAGMFCGSCMHDNTLARALRQKNVDVQLIPTYTPIRTDEEDVSMDRVFFGGINVFLQQKIPFFRYLPALIDRWFDNPRLLKWVSSRAMETSAKELGALTVSMLKGRSGYQRKEIRQLIKWLSSTVKPDIVVFSNMLVAGCIPAIKEALKIPVLVTLQGDDIFLDDLPEPYRSQSLAEIRRLVSDVDGFIANSNYYAQHMAASFTIPEEKLNIVPLGIDTSEFPNTFPTARKEEAKTIGYLARLAPEKGLHVLVDAFLALRKSDSSTNLKIAGWLGPQNEEYAEEQFAKLRAAGLESDFEYLGSIGRDEKIDFLTQLDILSVPTTYHEPKGLFVLEALAAGVPVVQPNHGAFPELLAATGGGRLTSPGNAEQLSTAIAQLLEDDRARTELARQGYENVHANFNANAMAERALDLYRSFTDRNHEE